MGAEQFMTQAEGKTPQEAFNKAYVTAGYDHGHGGYTGTIAEKQKFVLIDVPKGNNPVTYADELMDNDDKRIDDKWGPAGCVKIEDGKYLFFGWASS